MKSLAALIGGVVIAVFFRLHHIHQQPGQVGGVGRRAHLIVNNPDGVVFFAEIQHGFDKVFAVPSEYPGAFFKASPHNGAKDPLKSTAPIVRCCHSFIPANVRGNARKM